MTFTTKFHVHLPPNISSSGTPCIIGSVPELGSWDQIGVKLQQQSGTYWVSKEIKFPVSYNEKNIQIKYKYAVTSKPFLSRIEVYHEGYNERDDRTLENFTENQFDIWYDNNTHRIDRLRDF